MTGEARADTLTAALTGALTVAETRILTGRPFRVTDWLYLLQYNAGAACLHDLLTRGNTPDIGTLNAGTLNEAFEDLSRAAHPYLEVLQEMMKLALISGMLPPTMPLLSRICRVTPLPGNPWPGDTEDTIIDSQVLSDLIGEVYLNPAELRGAEEYATLRRALISLITSPEKLTDDGREVLLVSCAKVRLKMLELKRHARKETP